MPSRRQVILLHEDDNVLIAVAPIAAGDLVPVAGGAVPVRGDIAIGHKIARTALAMGDKVIRYGAPIGSATAAVAPGEWVHMHNMKSDYIAAHLRDDAREGA